MISVWWLIPAMMAGAVIGFWIAGMLSANGDD